MAWAEEPEGKGEENWSSEIRGLYEARDYGGLVDRLGGPYWTWVHAREALQLVGAEAADALLEGLASSDLRVRAASAVMLGGLGDRRAVGPVLDEFQRLDPRSVRGPEYALWEATTSALASLGVTEILPSLADLLETGETWKDDEVIQCAARALGRLGTADAVPALIARLDPSLPWNPFIERDVVEALRQIGEPSGVAVADAHEARRQDEERKKLEARRAHEATLTPDELAAERRERREQLRRRFEEVTGRKPPPER